MAPVWVGVGVDGWWWRGIVFHIDMLSGIVG